MAARRRALKLAAIGTWALIAAMWAASLALTVGLRDLYCEYPKGDSIYGDARVSVWPPGVTCVWDPPAVATRETREADWEYTISGGILGGAAAAFVALGVANRRRTNAPQRPAPTTTA